MFVYLIIDRDSGLIKIGKATDVHARLQQLLKQPTLLPKPFNFELLTLFRATRWDEYQLHRQFAHKRIRGEWFALTPTDVETIREYFNEQWEARYEEYHEWLMERRYGPPAPVGNEETNDK